MAKPDIAPEEILSGWKEIAQYLGKGVRTAQRSAKQLGLPVRRVSGKHNGSVMTSKSDLNSWMRSSPTQQESFNKEARSVMAYLSAELAKGPHRRALQGAVTVALRKELKKDIREIHESILKIRQQLNDFRKEQKSIAWMLTQISKRLAVNVKRKPN
jgi:hypothetical protein